MNSNNIFRGYHSTSKEVALEILSNGFKMPCIDRKTDNSQKDKFFKYWLGTGVYFYEDIDVARWWCNKPSKMFGVEGEHVILKSSLSPKNILDLRKVSDWKETVENFNYFCNQVGENFIVNIPETNSLDKNDEEYKISVDIKHKLRCMFFDWLHKVCNIDMIIAAFNQEEFDYLAKGNYKIEKYLDLYYTEVQYCVYDLSIITKTEKA